MQSFPQPLTAATEQYYLEKYAEGDIDAKNILVEKNLRLVAHIIKKYQTTDDEAEDLFSIGTIGLMKGIISFNPDKKVKLGTYAAKCIENEILMYLRSKKKLSKEISLYEPIGTDREGNEIHLFDIVENDSFDALLNISLQNDIKLLYSKLESVLTPRERMILKMRYGLYCEEEHTQLEIAKKLGISRSYVSRIEKSAIKKLRAYF